MEPPTIQAVALSPSQSLLYINQKQDRREDQMGTDPSPDIVPQKIGKQGTDCFMTLDRTKS